MQRPYLTTNAVQRIEPGGGDFDQSREASTMIILWSACQASASANAKAAETVLFIAYNFRGKNWY